MTFQIFIKSKKGNAIFDTFTFLVILVFLGMAIMMGKVLLSDWNSSMQLDQGISASVKEKIGVIDTNYAIYADGAILVFFIMFWIFMVVSAFMLDSHPIFFVFSLIGLILVIGFSGYMGNMYAEFITDGDIAAVVPLFPMANYILTHIVQFVMAVGFSSLLAIYAKNRLG